MKTLKKLFAIVLSMVMIVTGLYFVPTEADHALAETTTTNPKPSEDLLQVKAQTTKTQVSVEEGNPNYVYNGKYVLRFISSIDCLDYSQVGFRVTYWDEEAVNEETNTKGKTVEMWSKTSTVYERISSSTDVAEYSFSPKIVDTSAEYFITAKLAVSDTSEVYTVQAFCDTLDGERVWGQARCVAVDDVATNIVSLGVDVPDSNDDDAEKDTLSTKDGAYTATITSKMNSSATAVTKTGTVEVLSAEAGYANVRIALDDNSSVLDLASVTTVSIKSGETEVANGIYRHYETSYLSGTNKEVADTSWYDVYASADSEETKFVVATNADFYGFAQKAASENFSGKTVYAVADIDVNIGEAASTGWSAKEVDGKSGTNYPWTPIGTSSNGFAGTFDGQGHEISGISYNSTTDSDTCVGLFGTVGNTGVVSNFKLTNSYIRAFNQVGSVIGSMTGSIEDVYSNAYVICTANFTGGLIGYAYHTTHKTNDDAMRIERCWFDGSVSGKMYVGGLAACYYCDGACGGDNEVFGNYITDCLVTGVVKNSSSKNYVAGLVGREQKSDVHVTRCIVATREAISGGAYQGTFLGRSNATVSERYLTDCYATNESLAGEKVAALFENSATINSTSTYAFKDASELTGTSVYELIKGTYNLYSESNPEGVWTVTEDGLPELAQFSSNGYDIEKEYDDAWYYANPDATSYDINTADELKVLAEIVNNNIDLFASKTIYLSADIEVNAVEKGTIDAWKAETVALPESWTPIGNNAYRFKGIFDGQGYEISGIYHSTTDNFTGLFGVVENGTIQNVSITNSYFEQTGSGLCMGSVVGYLAGANGKILNVYSKADIESGSLEFAGIAGRASGTVSGCWFDGNIKSTKTTSVEIRCGGIVATILAADNLTISNCLNTGSINYTVGTENETSTHVFVGGIYGIERTGGGSVTITNCVNAGVISTNHTLGVGAIMGGSARKNSSTGAKTTNTLSQCYAANNSVSSKNADEVGIIGFSNPNTTATTQTECEIVDPTALKGEAIYANTDILLDYTAWIARKNDVVVPRCFVGTIVAENEVVGNQ